mmetsp:Transcript_36206/g.89091  ORF Transcript_36206/g.89091 Transcript_36206/m.89091 type:complete len:327 (+) Transcript_36206:403-1383(+)
MLVTLPSSSECRVSDSLCGCAVGTGSRDLGGTGGRDRAAPAQGMAVGTSSTSSTSRCLPAPPPPRTMEPRLTLDLRLESADPLASNCKASFCKAEVPPSSDVAAPTRPGACDDGTRRSTTRWILSCVITLVGGVGGRMPRTPPLGTACALAGDGLGMTGVPPCCLAVSSIKCWKSSAISSTLLLLLCRSYGFLRAAGASKTSKYFAPTPRFWGLMGDETTSTDILRCRRPGFGKATGSCCKACVPGSGFAHCAKLDWRLKVVDALSRTPASSSADSSCRPSSVSADGFLVRMPPSSGAASADRTVRPAAYPAMFEGGFDEALGLAM